MRQAIVLTSFGVGDAEERARTIDCIALDLRAIVFIIGPA